MLLTVPFKEVFLHVICFLYSYGNATCQMANIKFLEDPLPGMMSKEIFVKVDTIADMPMYCRGGAGCCNKDHKNMCLEGEGDCNTDSDCAGVLQCGNNNCLSFHPAGGGLWDAQDDCCERRCTPQHPCQIGGGQCLTDADCLNPGWAKCGLGKCLNTTYFPTNTFIFNTPTFGFKATDGCCYRVCNKNYHLCVINEIGCQTDEDCSPGLYCKTNVAQPFCADIDECDPGNGITPGYLICGDNAVCVNTIGSFNCSCNPGYQNQVAWQGCSDINECASPLTYNCTLYSQCFNIPGNYTCKCQVGYQGSPATGCYDIDECKSPVLNTCNGGMNSYGFNTETFGGESVKYFQFKKSPNLFSIKVRFELSTPDGAFFRLCSSTSTGNCYLLSIGGALNTRFSLFKNKINLAFVNHSTTHNLAVDMTNFKTFWMEIQLQVGAKLLLLAGSASDSASINFTDTANLISVGYIGLSTNSSGKTAFWRNVRVGTNLQSCLNNFGSYRCVDIDNEEYLGLGTGGTSGTSYLGKPVVITRDMISCSFSTMPSLATIASHGMAALGNWLFVCGGQSTFSSATGTACMKYDMDSNAGVWIPSTPLPLPRQDFGILSLFGNLYVMGGREFLPNWGISNSKNEVYKFSLATNAWATLARIPIPIYGQCVVSDENSSEIWSLGGNIDRADPYPSGEVNDVYIYNINLNTWTLHSRLLLTTHRAACGIVTLKTGVKRLMVVVDSATTNNIQYWDLYISTGWLTTNSAYLAGQIYMRMFSLTPYTLLAVAGQTSQYGQYEQNFFDFNLDNTNFQSGWNYLYSEMFRSAWIRVPRSYRSLANCISVIKYAAVGWGGGTSTAPTSYTVVWDVLLRSRSTAMVTEPRFPVRCDTAIPILSPGKFTPGITTVGYWLIVCGGNQYGKPAESTCVYLDTQQENPVWTSMPSMPVDRGDFPLVTYGDAAFAIGGVAAGVYLKQVDRWTKSLGWVTVAAYPGLGLSRHCAVADEGYDKIYSLGSYRCNPMCTEQAEAYQYVVSTNTWSPFPSLSYSSSSIGCAITRRGGTGKRMIIISGDLRYIQSFDLVTGTAWSRLQYYEQYGWDRPKLVSVTPWEVYKMGGSCSGCGYG